VASSTTTARSLSAAGNREVRRRAAIATTPAGGEVDLGDERLGRELPHLGDARIELADDEVCRLAVRESEATSRMETGRVASLAGDAYVEQILEAGDVPCRSRTSKGRSAA